MVWVVFRQKTRSIPWFLHPPQASLVSRVALPAASARLCVAARFSRTHCLRACVFCWSTSPNRATCPPQVARSTGCPISYRDHFKPRSMVPRVHFQTTPVSTGNATSHTGLKIWRSQLQSEKPQHLNELYSSRPARAMPVSGSESSPFKWKQCVFFKQNVTRYR